MHESKPDEAPDQAQTAWKRVCFTLIKAIIYADQIRKRQTATWTGEEDFEIRSHKEVH